MTAAVLLGCHRACTIKFPLTESVNFQINVKLIWTGIKFNRAALLDSPNFIGQNCPDSDSKTSHFAWIRYQRSLTQKTSTATDSCSHFTPDKDPGAAGPCPSPPSGGSFYGPTPVYLSTRHWSGRCHHLPPGQITVSPSEAWKHCEDYVLWFLQRFQHHSACIFGGQAGAHRGEPIPHILYPQLPHQPATVCEDSGPRVGHNNLQYRGPAGNSPGPFPVHPVHCRLFLPITLQQSTKVLWWLCYCPPHHQPFSMEYATGAAATQQQDRRDLISL